jgi:2-oxoglutarate dehydrogenase E2 component (dihydrolipoamide succinyltransferase)
MDVLYQVIIPYSGSVENALVNEWLVAVGDDVTAGQALADVSTDKVDMELEAPTAGKIVRFLIEAGGEVKVGTAVALIATPEASDDQVADAVADFDKGLTTPPVAGT